MPRLKLTPDEQAVRDELSPAEELALRIKTIRENVARRKRMLRIVAKIDSLTLRELDLIRDLLEQETD